MLAPTSGLLCCALFMDFDCDYCHRQAHAYRWLYYLAITPCITSVSTQKYGRRVAEFAPLATLFTQNTVYLSGLPQTVYITPIYGVSVANSPNTPTPHFLLRKANTPQNHQGGF
jgi:hypothetical protein